MSKKLLGILIGCCVIVAGVIYLFLGDTAIRQAIRLKKAEKHVPIIEQAIKSNPKFQHIKVGRYTGAGGCILMSGYVESQKDLEELKTLINTTKSPVEVKFILNTQNGYVVAPFFIKEILVNDKNTDEISNSSEFKIALLFDQYDKSKRIINFGKTVYGWHGKVYADKDSLILQCPTIPEFVIKENGILLRNEPESLNLKTLPVIHYWRGDAEELESKGIDYRKTRTVDHQFKIGLVKVKIQGPRCMDTGNNLVTVYGKKGILEFKNTHNIAMFEYDVDKNSIVELYILTYQGCNNFLRIYKVYK